MSRLTPARVAAGLRRRMRRWSSDLRDALPRRHRMWRDTPTPQRQADSDLVVATTTELRRWAAAPEQTVPVRRLTVVVQDWQAPLPGWSGRLGPLRHVAGHRIALPPGGSGRAEVSVDLAKPVGLRLVVAAVLDALEPSARLPLPVSPDFAVDSAVPGWLPLSRAQRPPLVGSAPTQLPAFDVLIGDAEDPVMLVDARTSNPAGRRRYDRRLPTGILCLTDQVGPGRWWVARSATNPTPVVGGRVGEPLDPRQRDVLANLSSITCSDSGETAERSYAATIAQLAMTGVLVHAPRLATTVADLLGPELASLLARPLPTDADPIERELASVRQRRAAMRRHAMGLALPQAARESFPSLSRPPAVTALLLTRRPERVPQALTDLAAQTYPELEVLVGLHGVGTTPAIQNAVQVHAGPIELVAVPAGLNFGEALADPTRRARGTLLTKVDDDDRYAAEHVWDLVLARHYSGATLVGKGSEFVYLAPRDLTIQRRIDSEVYDSYVAGGTILLGRGDLEAVGGWRPVPRSVDRGLLERVLAEGGLVYRTHGHGYLYTRGDDGHTWEAGLDHFDRNAVRRWKGLPPYPEFSFGSASLTNRAAAP